jgi:hypothetical protein
MPRPANQRKRKKHGQDEPATNADLPDVVTSLSNPIATSIAEAASNVALKALPDVVTSLPADVDADDDAHAHAPANTTSVTDTQPSNHPRATDLSTSTFPQEIKLEAVVKTETASTNPSTDQAVAPIQTESVMNGPNLNRTFTVRRKAAKRTPLPENITAPFSPSPQAEEIPARKKPRLKEPLSTTTDEGASKTPSPDISENLTSPDTPLSTDTVNASTHRRSRR